MEYWKLSLFGIFKITDAISYCIKRQLKSDVIIFPNTPWSFLTPMPKDMVINDGRDSPYAG